MDDRLNPEMFGDPKRVSAQAFAARCLTAEEFHEALTDERFQESLLGSARGSNSNSPRSQTTEVFNHDDLSCNSIFKHDLSYSSDSHSRESMPILETDLLGDNIV